MGTDAKYHETDVSRLFHELLKRIWLVVLSCVLAALLGNLCARFLVPPVYSTSVSFYVNYSLKDPNTAPSDMTVGQLSDTCIVMLRGRNILVSVIESSGTQHTYEEVLSMLDANAQNGTGVIKVDIANENAMEAYHLADAIANVLPARIQEMIEGTQVKVVDYPVLPQSPILPDVQRITVICGLLGAFLSAVCIMAYALHDNIIYDERCLLEAYNYPVLASIPNIHGKRTKGARSI